MFYHPETVDYAGEIIFSTSLIKIDIDPSDAVELLERASRLLNSPEPESNKNCEYCKYRDSKLG
jgi:CRISPR/Cas system-associated exonuclease Cas4 (RecB family)